jgi:hypothetical protein
MQVKLLDPNPIEQFGFDEFWNNSGALQHRPHTLYSDICEMFVHYFLNLNLRGKC